MSEPGCGGNCSWSVDVTEEDGIAGCPTTQSATPAWSSGTMNTAGLKTFRYAFTPDISTRSLHVCLYNQAGVLLKALDIPSPQPLRHRSRSPTCP